MLNHRTITPHQRAEIIMLYRDGMTYRRIAER